MLATSCHLKSSRLKISEANILTNINVSFNILMLINIRKPLFSGMPMTDIQAVTTDFTEGSVCCDTPITATLGANTVQQLADDLQLLAHPIRLQILAMLSQCEGQICVCDIEESLPVKQPTVSHHLRLLREAGLIGGKKRGLYVYYAVNQDAVQALWQRVQSGLTGII